MWKFFLNTAVTPCLQIFLHHHRESVPENCICINFISIAICICICWIFPMKEASAVSSTFMEAPRTLLQSQYLYKLYLYCYLYLCRFSFCICICICIFYLSHMKEGVDVSSTFIEAPKTLLQLQSSVFVSVFLSVLVFVFASVFLPWKKVVLYLQPLSKPPGLFCSHSFQQSLIPFSRSQCNTVQWRKSRRGCVNLKESELKLQYPVYPQYPQYPPLLRSRWWFPAIAIFNLKLWVTDPLTDRGRCKEMLSHLKRSPRDGGDTWEQRTRGF